MTSAESKATVRKYLEAFNDRDREALESLIAEDAVEHGVHERLRGADAIIEYLVAHYEAFPDYAGEHEAIVAEDDLVTVRYTATGTHTGAFKGVEPTGRRVEWTGLSMYRIEDGQIVESWVEEDRLGLLEQLEMIDANDPAHLRL